MRSGCRWLVFGCWVALGAMVWAEVGLPGEVGVLAEAVGAEPTGQTTESAVPTSSETRGPTPPGTSPADPAAPYGTSENQGEHPPDALLPSGLVRETSGEDVREELGQAGRSSPPALALEGPKPPPVPKPEPAEIERAIQRGLAFLIQHQNPDGSWGSARRTKGLNIYAPPPGAHHAFQTGATALALSALLEASALRPAWNSPELRRAIDRGEDWIFVHLPTLRRATPDALYNVWGHAYALQALAHMYARKPQDQARREEILRLVRLQIELLGRYETVDGGWCYYDFSLGSQKPAGSSLSFVSAAVLVALYDVKPLGVEVPRGLVDRAVASIQRQRQANFSYLYGEYLRWNPLHPVNRPAGSLGRSQVCNLALRLWGDSQVTDQVVMTWLDRLFARNGWLDLGRKRPIPHESFFAIAGYFFYYGHYYAARCIELLPPEKRPAYQDQLAGVLIRLQEADGSWWDYPLYDYHQAYGTGFALMSLVRTLPGR